MRTATQPPFLSIKNINGHLYRSLLRVINGIATQVVDDDFNDFAIDAQAQLAFCNDVKGVT